MLEPPGDLPAAHSMDTEWFAIDALGHVGVFDSGEGGEVPEAHFEQWAGETIWEELLAEIVALAPAGGPAFVADGVWDQLAGRYDSGELFTSIDALAQIDYVWDTSALLELGRRREPGEIAAVLEHGRPLGCAAPLVYVHSCEHGDLFAAWGELEVVRVILNPQLGPERFGVYAYECDSYSGGPYERSATPLGPPLRAESLATSLRRRLVQVRLGELDFARADAIWPSIYLPSTTRGA